MSTPVSGHGTQAIARPAPPQTRPSTASKQQPSTIASMQAKKSLFSRVATFFRWLLDCIKALFCCKKAEAPPAKPRLPTSEITLPDLPTDDPFYKLISASDGTSFKHTKGFKLVCELLEFLGTNTFGTWIKSLRSLRTLRNAIENEQLHPMEFLYFCCFSEGDATMT